MVPPDTTDPGAGRPPATDGEPDPQSEPAPEASPRVRARLARTSRLEAFSDGVFAIAITLLVLDLAIPETGASRQDLLRSFDHQWPSYLAYLVSFTTVGALWLGHSAVTDYLDHADGTFLRINLLVLLLVAFLPYPTRLLAEFIRAGQAERVASTIYGITLLVSTTLLWVLWRYARRADLIREDAGSEEVALLDDRLTPGLGGYVILIVVGLFLPVVAVIGYLVIGLFIVLPISTMRPSARSRVRRSRRDRRTGD